jgi:hypothetical protein
MDIFMAGFIAGAALVGLIASVAGMYRATIKPTRIPVRRSGESLKKYSERISGD